MNRFNLNKIFITTISLIIIIFLIWLTFESKGNLIAQISFMIITLVFIMIISSDYRILKVGFLGNIYLWIQRQEIQQKELETMASLEKKLRTAYFSKEYFDLYEKEGKSCVKLVRVENNIGYLDSSNVYMNLKKDLEFYLKQQDFFEYEEQKFECYSDPIAICTVDEPGKLSKIRIEWCENINKKDVIKKIKNNELKGLSVFAFIKIDDEIKTVSADKLEIAYDMMQDIVMSRYRW